LSRTQEERQGGEGAPSTWKPGRGIWVLNGYSSTFKDATFKDATFWMSGGSTAER